MLLYWIWLATRPNMHEREKLAVLERFGRAEDVYFASEDAYSVAEGLSQAALADLRDKSLDAAQKILSDCTRRGISILSWQDDAYPSRLKNIADPPVVLYYKGRLPAFDEEPMIGIVGTRKASAYGRTVAEQMGREVAQCGGIVVSGMAEGVDGMATEGALSQGRPAVGILGCGVDRIYPISNRKLFRKMEQQGCLISEYPPGTPPNKWNFPRRNRIISGLSCGVLVVEAPVKSGALITARQAMEQGRDVFVVPGNINTASCAGSNALLRDGATAALCGWDVLSEYESVYPDKIHQAEAGAQKEPDKKSVDKQPAPSYSDLETTADLPGDEGVVLSHLKGGEQNIDELIAEAGLSAAAVLAALTMLEVKGYVQTLPGRRVIKK